MFQIPLILLSYLIGAIPVGYLIAKRYYHIDIRLQGSGNPGATNVWRTLGRKPGIITLVLDILKGFLPALAARLIYPGLLGLQVFCGLMAIVGHNWTVFLNWKGGKGVATSAGVFLAIIPVQSLMSIAMFAALFYFTGFVSVGSIGAAVGLVAATFIVRTAEFFKFFVFAAAAMVIVKHIPNMKRLARGEENKVKLR